MQLMGTAVQQERAFKDREERSTATLLHLANRKTLCRQMYIARDLTWVHSFCCNVLMDQQSVSHLSPPHFPPHSAACTPPPLQYFCHDPSHHCSLSVGPHTHPPPPAPNHAATTSPTPPLMAPPHLTPITNPHLQHHTHPFRPLYSRHFLISPHIVPPPPSPPPRHRSPRPPAPHQQGGERRAVFQSEMSPTTIVNHAQASVTAAGLALCGLSSASRCSFQRPHRRHRPAPALAGGHCHWCAW